MGLMKRAVAGVLLLTAMASVAAAQPSPTAVLGDVRVNPTRPIDFHAAAYPDTVYVGQQITYQVAVLLSEQARSRLRRNPEFLPPELRGLLAYELGTPRRVAPQTYAGAEFEAHVFQRALFPVAPGPLRIPSPQLTYSLPQSSSYFSREESYVVRAESASVVVRPLPEEGRPADFTGAVGVLTLSTRVDANEARVGDPFVLTVRVDGVGNVKLLPRPALELSWASVVAGSERVRVDSSGARVRGVKEFDYLVTPVRAGPVLLPVLRYAYFDPYRAEYAWAESPAADISIAAGDAAPGSESGDDDSPQLNLRDWRNSTPPRDLLGQPTWKLMIGTAWFGAPLLVLALVLMARRGARTGDAPAVAKPERAPEPEPLSPAATARRVRRELLRRIQTRLQLDEMQLAERRMLERALRRHGVTRATTQDLLAWLDRAALVGYGGMDHMANPSTACTAQSELSDAGAQAIAARIDAEAVTAGQGRRWMRWRHRGAAHAQNVGTSRGHTGRGLGGCGRAVIGVGLWLSSAQRVPVMTPPASAPDAPARAAALSTADLTLLDREARAAYDGRRFARAAAQWARASEARPRDTDLLVNWGTAAWAAGDTVSAVLAWQRAARIDPMAADVQERLLLLPPTAHSGLADVPMVPVNLLVLVATGLWMAGWIWLLVVLRRLRAVPKGTDARRLPHRPSRAPALALLVVAAAGMGYAYVQADALRADGLAVVQRPDMLRSAPHANATPAGGVGTGDVVRLAMRRGEWVQVRHADGRTGWLPHARVVSFD
jgi:hypothetical protein